MKLASLSFNAIPRMPGFRPGDIASIDCNKPNDAFVGWRVSIRGQQVFFISPPGGKNERTKQRDLKGPITIFETSRSEVTFQWSCSPDEVETILKGGKFDSEPFGPPPALASDKPLLAQIPVSQVGDA